MDYAHSLLELLRESFVAPETPYVTGQMRDEAEYSETQQEINDSSADSIREV